MPSVAQVCSPRPFTASTSTATFSTSRSLGARHAAPMQKRVAPASFAACAARTTSSTSMSFCAFTPVSNSADCGQ
jgi:hypothetical protein